MKKNKNRKDAVFDIKFDVKYPTCEYCNMLCDMEKLVQNRFEENLTENNNSQVCLMEMFLCKFSKECEDKYFEIRTEDIKYVELNKYVTKDFIQIDRDSEILNAENMVKKLPNDPTIEPFNNPVEPPPFSKFTQDNIGYVSIENTDKNHARFIF
jgi:hypothetical protein